MRSIIISIVGLVPLVFAAPATLATRETDIEATDRLLFSTSITDFEKARSAKNPASLDWTSDGCSDSPDNPLGFDFSHSCHRHDFGYRNYKKQSRFTDANKLKIDNNFKNDMYNQCQTEVLKSLCKDFANIYYVAVREFGSKRAVEIMDYEDKMKREAKEDGGTSWKIKRDAKEDGGTSWKMKRDAKEDGGTSWKD